MLMQLKKTLKDFKNIIIEPVAISNINEKKDFYFVKGNSINTAKETLGKRYRDLLIKII